MATLPRWLHDRRVTLVVFTGTLLGVVSVYLLVVLGGGALIGQTDSPNVVLSVLATAIVALGFEPATTWLEDVAEGWFHQGRRTPYDVLSRFTESVIDQRAEETGRIDPAELPARMARLLADGTGAQWAQVLLIVDGTPELAATWPTDAPGIDAAALDATGPDSPGVRSLDVVLDGERLGILRVHETEDQPLGVVAQRLFTGLAAQAGLVLYRARLRADLARRADELAARADDLQESRQRLVDAHDAERRRLERDIHDGAQQHLVALVVNLRLAQTLAQRAPERARAVLDEQVAAVDTAIATLVALSRGLYPQALSEEGVAAALRIAVGGAPGSGAVPVTVIDHGIGRLPDEVEAAVYFSTVEAVQNAAKHASATTITVELATADETARVVVRDDGVGFDPKSARAGNGLGNMRDRIDAVGGALLLHSRPGDGAEVSIAIPTHVEQRAG
jgi:signal transduction histidine kinase